MKFVKMLMTGKIGMRISFECLSKTDDRIRKGKSLICKLVKNPMIIGKRKVKKAKTGVGIREKFCWYFNFLIRRLSQNQL